MEFKDLEIKEPTLAIICFGPMTGTTGYRAGEFYQVLIDPTKVSPCGQYIQFTQSGVCQVHGWQRIEALTICSLLGTGEELPNHEGPITMRAIS